GRRGDALVGDDRAGLHRGRDVCAEALVGQMGVPARLRRRDRARLQPGRDRPRLPLFSRLPARRRGARAVPRRPPPAGDVARGGARLPPGRLGPRLARRRAAPLPPPDQRRLRLPRLPRRPLLRRHRAGAARPLRPARGAFLAGPGNAPCVPRPAQRLGGAPDRCVRAGGV
ncbi:MAG: hypothetical protein AVDCRST_MAG19-2420, partial [uncultured Thermomicrobiales bacterium]